jgi:hypothetical protein
MTTIPDVDLPPRTEAYTDWMHDSDGAHRIIWGDARQVDTTQVSLQPHAIQLADGSMEVNTESAGDRPGIAIDEVRDGKIWEHLNVTVEGARALTQALLEAADEVEGWAR